MANKLKKFTQITLQREAQNLVTAQGCLYAPGLHATCLGCWQLTSPSCLPPSPLRAPMPTSPGEKHAKPLRWPVDWQTRGQVAGLPLIHTFNISAIHTVKFFHHITEYEVTTGCKILTGTRAEHYGVNRLRIYAGVNISNKQGRERGLGIRARIECH